MNWINLLNFVTNWLRMERVLPDLVEEHSEAHQVQR